MRETDVKSEILDIFRRSEDMYVSGEDVSQRLGFSRASVWKYIKGLRKEGYLIEAVPHLGYRLAGLPDRLLPQEIAHDLGTDIVGGRIHHFDTIESTNDKAYRLAEEGEPEGTVIIAETQTRGKGRMGRKWVSPGKTGVYLSVILRPDTGTDEIQTLALIAGVSVISVIRRSVGIEAALKWPNDVMIADRKVCGILTEVKAQPDIVEFLVLGIGINVNTESRKLPGNATSIKIENGREIERVSLVKEVLRELEKNYRIFRDSGFGGLRDECKRVSSVLGKKVRVTEHQRVIEGMAIDIDEKGALILELEGGEVRRLFSGDVTSNR